MDIRCPDIDRRVRRMERADMDDLVRKAALKVAPEVRSLLRLSARAAGASRGMQQAVTIHDGHDNDLVMYERGNAQDVLVGVSGSSPYADEAEAMEWGSHAENPTFWVRSTWTDHAPAIAAQYSAQLTERLQRVWR